MRDGEARLEYHICKYKYTNTNIKKYEYENTNIKNTNMKIQTKG